MKYIINNSNIPQFIIENYLLPNYTFNQLINNSDDISYELYEIPNTIILLLTLCYVGVCLCATLGNFMVLWVVFTSKMMRTVTNLFIANLAIADIVIADLTAPLQFQAAVLQEWILPSILCALCPTAEVVSFNVSIFTLVVISIDRHRAVSRPIAARMFKVKAILIIISIWVCSIIISWPTFVMNAVKKVWVEKKSAWIWVCAADSLDSQIVQTYRHILVVLQYLIPLFIISFAYIHMAIILNSRNITTVTRNDSLRAIQNKKRVIKMLFIVIALFAICWFPLQLYNTLVEIYPGINSYKYINLIWFGCHWLSMSNSCYNPFIYAIYGERFKAEFKNKFHQMFKCSCYDNKAQSSFSLHERKQNNTSIYRKSIPSSASPHSIHS